MRLLFFWFCFCLFAATQAQQPVLVKSQTRIANLAFDARFLEDPSGRLQWQDFSSSKIDSLFQPVRKPIINFGVTSSVFLIKTKVCNKTGTDLLLKIGHNSLSDLRVFEAIGNKLVKQYHSGGWLPFKEREVQDVDLMFPLHIPTDSTATVYIQVRHDRGTQFSLEAGTIIAFYNEASQGNVLQGIYFGFMLLMILYNLFIYFTLKDSFYLYYIGYVFLIGLFNATIAGYAFQFLWPDWPILNRYEDVLSAMVCMAGILFTVKFLNTKQNAPLFHKLLLGLLGVFGIVAVVVASGNFVFGSIAVETTSLVLVLVLFATAYAVLRKGYKPAVFFLLAWSLLLLSVIIFVLKDFNVIPNNAFTENVLEIGSAVEALLLSMALANRINVYKKEKEAAQLETLRSMEENRKLITEQNVVLEKKVAERTGELKETNAELVSVLTKLQNTQKQMVHREKMASLGELTAGIAHEIQNPLNFINNFSEVNQEMMDELKEKVQDGSSGEALEIADEMKDNGQKIILHGKRIDAILKNMLQHSRASKGEKLPTDINAMAEEYLRISYNGMRIKDQAFNVACKTLFDKSIGNVVIAPQEIGRVLLNLYNNAFYAVNEKKQRLNGSFEPMIEVSTRKGDNKVEILVRDNGIGIPQKTVDKIFQPFFTTKPTGEGTGLGLSLSYDIITKGHGGELKVASEEGKGAEFQIVLPCQ